MYNFVSIAVNWQVQMGHHTTGRDFGSSHILLESTLFNRNMRFFRDLAKVLKEQYDFT